jgi:ATP-dependent RNA helicase DeaD
MSRLTGSAAPTAAETSRAWIPSGVTDQEPEPTFAVLGLDRRVLQSVLDVGYEVPSPIQAQAIPVLLDGRDLVGLAQTGTGKTAAFALPILSRIDVKKSATQALVIAPTRELVLQVAEAFGRYAHRIRNLHVLPVYGGQSYGPQLHGLRRGAQVIVGTPGRVIDHLEKKTLDLGALRHLVLDEADEMLRMGFQEEVERILADTPEDKQIALFSATMPAPIRKIAKRYLHDPVEITVKTKTVTAARTNQRYLYVTWQQKMDALTRVLEVEPFEAMIIFVRTKSATEDVAERLRSRGFAAEAINGDLNQAQREKVIAQLRDGRLDLLVATDVAARGLDVDRVTHVVNYDIPTDPESYVHRIGRTGRAGRSGEALLFVTPREKGLLNAIEKATRQRLTEMQLPSAADVNAQRVARFHDAITAALSAPTQSVFKGLVLDYAREHDVPMADIAAALAVMSREDEAFLLPPDATPEKRTPRERDIKPELASYRISVGRRHRVTPAQIVGAIANEGGLDRSSFGKIDIRPDYSLVELPAHLPKKVQQALVRTRIGNQLIELKRERSAGKAGPARQARKARG